MPASGLKKEFGDQRHALAYAEIKERQAFLWRVAAGPHRLARVTLGILHRDGLFCHIYFKLWPALDAAPTRPYWSKVKGPCEEPDAFEKVLVYRALAEQYPPCQGVDAASETGA